MRFCYNLAQQEVYRSFDGVDWPLETERVSVFYVEDYCV
jgi:hypothetical protein